MLAPPGILGAMIRKRGDLEALGKGEPAAELVPWEGGGLRRLALVTLWATGPDPGRDHVFRMQALRRADPGGEWERFERWCGSEDGQVSARMAREFGVEKADFEDARAPEEAWSELAAFLEGRVVIVGEREGFRTWALELGAGESPPFRTLDLVGLARLFLPGRLASAGERLPARLLGPESSLARHPLAVGPEELHAALAVLVGRVLGTEDDPRLALIALGHREVWRGLRRTAPDAAEELGLALRLVEHPSCWRDAPGELFLAHEALTDGRLGDAVRAWSTIEDAVDAAEPVWARRSEEDRESAPLRANPEEEVVLSAPDARLVDEIFQEHVPRVFAERGESGTSYREGQHQVAAETARSMGRRELFLVHAPTGTGKTLAYLVPVLVWALRNETRVGVATFTRALQEQAMDRDVPIARELLRRAGVAAGEDELRISVLKGRNNYVCWRALRLQSPLPGMPPDDVLAWLTLALFATSDRDGDLDRLPRKSPLAGVDESTWRGALAPVLRLVRAESSCCSRPRDRRACGAEAARRRAERSHLVITNHAFALARREFFRHIVFDECEHLHDVAHDAFSHLVELRTLAALLARFRGTSRRRRGPLDRIAGITEHDSPAGKSVHRCLESCEIAVAALGRLKETISDFKLWREDAARDRKDSETHSLFREFVLEGDAGEMLESHRLLASAMNELSAELARLSEHLDTLPTRGVRRIRRSLSVLRGELDELQEGVEAWIPREDEGRPFFRNDTFYDVETRPRGGDALAGRVLLPHEFLGRHYYPELAGAIFLSATTWLRDGFDTAATYLGLLRAGSPAADEEREPCSIRTFRAPEVFDYGRVLVCAPRDAPPIRSDKRGFLDYVARFVAYLAERTRGRTLVLFTNAMDLARTGQELEGFFAARRLPFWYQRMEGTSKEELGDLFRSHTDSVLLGLDTFWYGADFPGPTLEYLVIVRLPYGVPDRYHHAQSAALGSGDQRRQIYLPRALAKFRQGFGRLMRKESDRGCVFLLDGRAAEPRHRMFLRELPLTGGLEQPEQDGLARFVRGETDRCLHEAFAHQELLADIRRRGLDLPFTGWRLPRADEPSPRIHPITEEDVPF